MKTNCYPNQAYCSIFWAMLYQWTIHIHCFGFQKHILKTGVGLDCFAYFTKS